MYESRNIEQAVVENICILLIRNEWRAAIGYYFRDYWERD